MKTEQIALLSEPQCCWSVAASLGEGVLWSADAQCVWFVDILGCSLHRYKPLGGKRDSWRTPSRPGFIAELSDGGLLIGLVDGLYRFNEFTEDFDLLVSVEAQRTENRINDGAIAPDGRLWFGTKNELETAATGGWFSWSGTGQPNQVEEGYVVTNGPAFSKDGRTLYHCDSVNRQILFRSLSVEGQLGDNHVFAEIEEGAGYPDGIAIDAEGYLWVALFNGWGVRRYAPDGRLIQTLSLPCAHVTKPAFGGPDGMTLYLTTASVGLSDDDKTAQPLAGGLFSIRVQMIGQVLPKLQCVDPH